ncbi:MAG: hypothetical protein WBX15_20100, partial [Thermoanaerobaculia bacterium]
AAETPRTTTQTEAPAPQPTAPPPAAPAEAKPPAEAAPATSTMQNYPNRPKTHTVSYKGIFHAPGADNPAQKCAVCHGKDLKGGKVATVSCYSCHDKKWK